MRHLALGDEMNHLERAELERQGAKAAARGDDLLANPLVQRVNQPGLTGECPERWARRRDAWQVGYDWQLLDAEVR